MVSVDEDPESYFQRRMKEEQQGAEWQERVSADIRNKERALVDADAGIAHRLDLWLGAVDRSSLGFFAFPLDVLAAVDALTYGLSELYETEGGEGWTLYMTVAHEQRVREAFERFGYSANSIETEGNGKAVAELAFWWERATGKDYYDDESTYRPRERNLDHLDKIQTVIDNPSMHPYFAAGLWDTEFIARCISDDVEPNIAVSVGFDR